MKNRLNPTISNNSQELCKPDKAILYQKYIVEGTSVAKLSREFKRAEKTIRDFLKKHRIPIRNNSESKLGDKNHQWKGGETLHQDGHVLVKTPNHPHANKNGYVLRSRLVMEKHLGRYLEPGEIVHHKNEKKDDDQIENLRLFPSVGEHVSFHHEIRFSRRSKPRFY